MWLERSRDLRKPDGDENEAGKGGYQGSLLQPLLPSTVLGSLLTQDPGPSRVSSLWPTDTYPMDQLSSSSTMVSQSPSFLSTCTHCHTLRALQGQVPQQSFADRGCSQGSLCPLYTQGSQRVGPHLVPLCTLTSSKTIRVDGSKQVPLKHSLSERIRNLVVLRPPCPAAP